MSSVARALFYFYPRPPRGGRPLATQLASCCCEFLSTPSARRATLLFGIPLHLHHNFYPRPPRGGRHTRRCDPARVRPISIHALREEGDPAPRPTIANSVLFLSTPSARRATHLGQTVKNAVNISIHALREEGDGVGSPLCAPRAHISIHALREEGDALISVSIR